MNPSGTVRTAFCTVLLCLLLTGCSSPQGQPGILAEEAMQGASLDDLTSSLSALLESREADTFAGLWIQQEPEYRVIVAFTRKGRDTIRKYVKDTPLAELIEVRVAKASLAELVAAEQEANQLVQELGFPFSTAVDVEGNRAVLWITDRAQFEAALQDASRQLPEHVEVVVVYQPPVQAPAGITPVPDVAFPQLRARSTMVFDLLPLQGRLLIKDGCLRVSDRGRAGAPDHLAVRLLPESQPRYRRDPGQGWIGGCARRPRDQPDVGRG